MGVRFDSGRGDATAISQAQPAPRTAGRPAEDAARIERDQDVGRAETRRAEDAAAQDRAVEQSQEAAQSAPAPEPDRSAGVGDRLDLLA